MSEDRTPRIDRVVGEYERRGLCDWCGKKVKKTREIAGATLEEVEAKAALWTGPLLHKKCGG